jgi:hypothetical protein
MSLPFSVYAANFFLNGEDIQQCLSGMFANSISSVDDRLSTTFGSQLTTVYKCRENVQ